MVETLCAWCFRPVMVFPSKLGKNNYCGRSCRYAAMAARNRKHNTLPMSAATREKIRAARLKEDARGYTKCFGKHEHRLVAESILCRPLERGEVVHHIDKNKRNNSPDNLVVFKNQAEHARYHKLGGDFNDFQATCLSAVRH